MSNLRNIFCIAGAFIIIIAISSNAQAFQQYDAQSIMETLHTPKAANVIEASLLNLNDSEKVKVWIYFTDKGIYSQSEYNSALDQAKSALTERAIKRRSKVRGENIVDFRDIPINPDYVRQVTAMGAELKHKIKWLNSISAYVFAADIDDIAPLPFVRRIEKVKSFAKNDNRFEPGQSLERPAGANGFIYDYGPSFDQLVQVNVPPAHVLGFDGSDVLVCMLDVGYKKGHDAFAHIISDGRLIAEWDFVNGDGETDLEPGDDPDHANHGTYCWSALGGEADGHLYGPAFNASFILGKTEDITMERHIEEDNWAAAALWADSIGAEVISASLGYRWFDEGEGDYEYSDLDGNTTIVTIAADLAAYNGIAVCTAQGNEGYDGQGSLIAPADGDSVIACGAVDIYGDLASFSSLGPTYDGRTKPEVVARGLDTHCAAPWDLHAYTQVGGTSLATPLVGGAAAVILSAHPNWTPMQVREALMMTADNFDNPDNYYGWGIANTMKAIQYDPEGDIAFDFTPLYYAPPNQDIELSADITCSEGLNESSVILYWNNTGSAIFESVPMDNSGDTFTATIPAQEMGAAIYYYLYAEKDNGLSETYPTGTPNNRFEAEVSSPKFADDFENGDYYWETDGDYPDWGVSATYSVSGNMSLHDSPQGSYRKDAEVGIKLREPLDFSDANNPQLVLRHRYRLRTGSDSVFIEGSTDGGNNWTTIGDGVNGELYSFEMAAYSLADFAGSDEFLLRFRLSTINSYGQYDGYYVDDIAVYWEATDVEEDENPPSVPGVFALRGNYPNPFNAKTIIEFTLPNPGEAIVDIFNVAGRRVRSLNAGALEAGNNRIIWNGLSENGSQLSSGIYFAKLNFGGQSEVIKMTLAK